MATLSLCLIAKNEEAFLPGCLQSVAGVVDQIVVADTGSTDGTVAIAEAAGAQVVHHVWTDDFSAARNAALGAATGDWVLVLDADERLVGGDALRRALEGAPDVSMIRLHNAASLDAPAHRVLDGTARLGEPIDLPRVFRRTPDLRWEGRIHEEPRTWLLRGRRIGHLDDVAIVHLGCVPSVLAGRGKSDRNIRLLEARCAEAPDDVVAWSYLAGEYLDDGRLDEARSALDSGWGAAARLPPGHGLSLVPLITLRATRQLAEGQAEAALETVRTHPKDHPNLWFLEAVALSRLAPSRDDGSALRDHALRLLDRCLAWDGRSLTKTIPGVGTYGTRTLRGELLVAEGRLDEAGRAFESACSDHPDPRQPQLGRIEVAIRQGRAAGALSALEPLLDDTRPDAWILAALASRELDQPRELVALTSRAEQLASRGCWAAHRAADLAELRCEAALYGGRFVPGPGEIGRLAALTFRVPDRAPPVPAARAGRVALGLLERGRADALEAWLEPRGDARVPGLRALVEATLGANGVSLDDDGEPDFVFVGGCSAGRALLRARLAAHPRFHTGPTVEIVAPLMARVATWKRTLGPELAEAGVDEPLLDAAARSFLETFLRGQVPHGLRRVEEIPHDLVAALGRLFPRARFLQLTGGGSAMLPGAGVSGRFLEIRQGALADRPEDELRRVLAFLGEAWNDAVLLPVADHAIFT